MGSILIGEIRQSRWLDFAVGLPAAIFVLVQVAAVIAAKKELVPIELPTPVYYYTVPLCAGGVAALYQIWKGNLPKAITSMAVSLFVLVFVAGLSIEKLNDMIGLENASLYAMDEMKKLEKSSGRKAEVVYYDFRSGDNLDVYFGHPVNELKKENLQEASNMVMVVKERRFKRDSVLNAALGSRPRKLFGEFAIVTVE